jgi:hypothetical protein
LDIDIEEKLSEEEGIKRFIETRRMMVVVDEMHKR